MEPNPAHTSSWKIVRWYLEELSGGRRKNGTAPWREEKIAGGYVVRDANGQALVYIFARTSESEAVEAKVLTMDEAGRIAVNIVRLPELLKREEYCQSDVVNTYRVWLRYELFRGRLSDAEFQASVEFIRARGNTKPHLAELT
jgi:Predicted 3'-5' exonuclease related to the exonuclease domain of PolB